MPNFFKAYSHEVFLPVRLCQPLTDEERPRLLRYDPAKTWYRPSDEVKQWLVNTGTDHHICFSQYYEDGAIVQVNTKAEVAIMKLAFNMGEKEDVL
jgi:hypothetical protein